jgi:hypothetical protein
MTLDTKCLQLSVIRSLGLTISAYLITLVILGVVVGRFAFWSDFLGYTRSLTGFIFYSGFFIVPALFLTVGFYFRLIYIRISAFILGLATLGFLGFFIICFGDSWNTKFTL